MCEEWGGDSDVAGGVGRDVDRDECGMYNYGNSSPIISNCAFSGNESDNGGGGMYNDWGTCPKVSNCIFVANMAVDRGGGIYNDYSSGTVTNCTFGVSGSSCINVLLSI
ncbi:MAG: hypothetical protein ACYS1A_06570 [Planctomycetota bacterium]